MTHQGQKHPGLRAKFARNFFLVAGLSTSPGVAFGALPPDASSIGPIIADSVPLWDQLSFLRSYAGQLEALPSTYSAAGSGSWLCDIGTVVESESVSSHQAQTQYRSETVADSIAGIRSAFSLQIKELAQILKVERPTIYAWMKGFALPQQHNQIRLRQIHRLAMQWNRLSDQPTGTGIHELDAAGRSVVDYLKENVLPEETIMGRLEAIAVGASTRATSRKPRLSELAQKHGIGLKEIREQGEEFDIVTGKPFSVE